MLFGIINSIKGCFTIRAEGRFPERVLNIASTNGIYIHNVKRDGDSAICFSVSKKGAEKLLEMNIEGLSLTIADKRGVPVFFRRYRKRIVLILLPVLFLTATGIFSLFVWKIEIEGGDEALRREVSRALTENGVYIGALKHQIDSYDVKRRAIMEIDDLAWIWVDVKGTTANVKLRQRTKVPSLLKINEPADVISTYDGVIEKIKVYCGIPLFKEGMTVEKGQIVVSGVLRSENENIPTYYHHATADITLRLNEKNTYIIPKKTFRKVPTGNKKTVFSINSKKNNVKFSLNSGISYSNYDKIEKTVKIPFLPVSFTKTTYLEVDVTEEATDIPAETRRHRLDFIKSLESMDMDIISLGEGVSETSAFFKVTFNAECLVRADKEIPIATEGVQNGENY